MFVLNVNLNRMIESVKNRKEIIIKIMYRIDIDKFVNSDENNKRVRKIFSFSRVICIFPNKNRSKISNMNKIMNPIEKILSHFKTTSRFIDLITS